MKGSEQERLAVPADPAPWRWSGFARAAIALPAIALILFIGGFILFATHVGNIRVPAEPRPADAIIVLTGGSARVDTGVRLLMAGKGGRLFISGVNPMARVEDIRRATGGNRDLFACCVDIDHAALDTIGNAEESARWVRANGFGSVILVTNNYHMPRSLMEMRRYLSDVDLQPYAVVNRRIDRGEWLRRPGALRVLFTEYVKLIGSFVRGIASADAIRGQVAAVSSVPAP
jgi:uncharacterized SAM-binding protein YcdF (DUF218 family)